MPLWAMTIGRARRSQVLRRSGSMVLCGGVVVRGPGAGTQGEASGATRAPVAGLVSGPRLTNARPIRAAR